jgi:hypothetical protein
MCEITNKLRSRTIAIAAASCLAVAGALALGTSPAAAAPISTNAIAVNDAAPGNVIDVRRRGRHHGHWGKYAAAGFALGFLGGAFAPHWGYGHYPHASFGYGYYPAFGYYPPVHYYSPRRCWTGWGWTYC